jgi:hypothetical protein
LAISIEIGIKNSELRIRMSAIIPVHAIIVSGGFHGYARGCEQDEEDVNLGIHGDRYGFVE